MAVESIIFDVDPRSVLAAVKAGNAAMESLEKGASGANDAIQKSFEKMSDILVKVTDRNQKAQERYVQSLERQATIYGRSGVEKLVADRDRVIKKLGDEQAQIDRVTAAYAKMIKVEQERGSGGGGNTTSLAFRGIRDLFEGRTAFAEVAGGKALASLSGLPLIIGSAAAAFVGLGIAVISSMRSLAAYGTEVRNAELRTGFTSKEVAQFGFAAKVVGQDISIFERLMRGLTQAVEDSSVAGDKARKWLISFGVDLRGVRDGSVATATVFEQIAEGLGKITSPLERNKAELDLFKRVGIEAIPVIQKLEENLKIARQYGFGSSESDITKMTEYAQKLEIVSTLWDEIVRHVKEYAVESAASVISAAENRTKYPSSGTGAALRAPVSTTNIDLGPGMPTNYPSGQQAIDLTNQLRQAQRAADDASVRAFSAGLGAQGRLKAAEKELSKLQYPQEHVSTRSEVDTYATAVRLVEVRKKEVEQVNELNTFLKQLDEQHRTAGNAELSEFDKINAKATEQIAKLREYGAAKDVIAARSSQINADAVKEIDLLNKKKDEQLAKELRSIEIETGRTMLRLGQQRGPGVRIRELGQDGVTASDIEHDINAQYERSIRNAASEYQSERGIAAGARANGGGDDLAKQREEKLAIARADAELTKTAGEAELAREKQLMDLKQRAHDEDRRAADEIAKIKEQDVAAEIKHRYDLRSKIAELSDKHDDPARGIAIEYALRIQEANELYAAEEKRIGLREFGNKADISHAKQMKDFNEATDKAHEDALLKMFELQQRQLDEIKSKASGLFNTLFTDPSKFGSQLAATLKAAVLKPITDGLGEITAKVLHPVVFGQDGQGGIAGVLHGIFGGGKDRGINDVKLVNGAVPVVLTNMPGTSVPGFSGGASASQGGGGGGGGAFSNPIQRWAATGLMGAMMMGGAAAAPRMIGGEVIGGGDSTAGLTQNSSGLWQRGGSSDIGSLAGMIGPGGTPGFAQGSLGLGGGGGGGVFGGGGGAAPGGGIGGLLKSLGGNLKGINFGGLTRQGQGIPGVDGQPGTDEGGDGKITGVNGIAGAALMTGGMMLAQQGLLGSSRGTVGGVAMGALGGAAVGFALGGPIGAAIGAGVGLLTGVGEMIAGVESPENEAKRLVKSVYRVSIDTAMAKQIVAVAQQKYGGQVSVAVRDPDVRNLIMLYAQATGNKNMPLSSTVPHGGSLVEQNGGLSQAPTFVNGTPYVYQSSLPTAGGFASNTFPNPGGGPISLSLNVGGQGAAQFVAGQVVTPEFVQAQWGSAQQASNGRVQNSAWLQAPGLVTG